MSNLTLFRYNIDQVEYELDLRRCPDYKSNETSGVWVYGNWAWKIYPNMNQWYRIERDYLTAQEQCLPIPSYRQIRGIIFDQRGGRNEGFALATTHITAQFFALKSGIAPLTQFIDSIDDDNTLVKIERGFAAAINMGLRDPQGFIDRYDFNPVVFIDLHTCQPPATSLREVYDHVRARRATVRQQWGQWR